MLQRAASNAYSWWWASHIRTKQSKWLEENLQDMEDKINDMLRIIENNGDSFAQRAEMYYKKRPELVTQVEETYRAYRALAERYDKLSKDMQSANRTIATIFPEQVQLMEDFEEDGEIGWTSPSDASKDGDKVADNPNIPKVPSQPMKEFRSLSMSRKGQLSRTISTPRRVAATPSSGLSKEEAVEEIDKLQKEILALQTEKEFIQSITERCNMKSHGIEEKVSTIQGKISALQDEFRVASVIGDNEARTLMAKTALKSCKETLVKLEEKQGKAKEQSKVEEKRIDAAQQKFMALRRMFGPEITDVQEEPRPDNMDQQDTETFKEKIKRELEADLKSASTVMQLADRIDELVEKVAHLETAVSSQNALVNRLRSETDGLQDHVRTLEEDKEALKENSEVMSNKLKELEEELRNIKSLKQNINIQNNNLQNNFTEANYSIDHLTMRLQNAKLEEETESEQPAEGRSERLLLGSETLGTSRDMIKEENDDDKVVQAQNLSDVISSKKDMERYSYDTESNLGYRLGEMEQDDGEEPNWKKLFMCGIEDREKVLLEEYTSVLQNYRDVRKKLGDVEKKNRDSFFQLAMQIRELKGALSLRDEELKSYHKGNPQEGSIKDRSSHSAIMDQSPESILQSIGYEDSNPSFLSTPQQLMFDPMPNESKVKLPRAPLASLGTIRRHALAKELRADETKCPVSAVEAKIRSDIDELLEENLEFWLRFSTSFHQIRKFQTSVHDLKVELSKLRDDMREHNGNAKVQTVASEARPIYKHLREIQTDLTMWLENNSLLKDEMQSRFGSLCSIQEELSKVMALSSAKGHDAEISEYQAAKFQGELMNMKQESTKVAGEIHTGLERVRALKAEVEKTMARMDEELGILSAKNRSPSIRARIPLRSFLFGVKLKKHRQQKQLPSLFACASPALPRNHVGVEP